MGLRIGPRALDPMAGYRPDWAPAGPGPDAPGRGVPKWRVLLVLGAIVGLLTQLPTERAFAGAWSLPNVECTNGPVTVAVVDGTGNEYVSISYHLVIANGGTVQGRWIASGGFIGPAQARSAGESGAGDWWITNQGVTIAGTASGSLSFVMQKAAAYGGCFSVDHIVVMTVPEPAPNPTGSGGGYTAPPPSTSPTPPVEPDYTIPPGYNGTCRPVTGDPYAIDCDDPPPGFCWTGSWMGGLGPRLEPCQGPPVAPTPTPPPGPDFTMSCHEGDFGGGCEVSHSPLAVGAQYRVVFRWAKDNPGAGYWGSDSWQEVRVGSGATECRITTGSSTSGSIACNVFTIDNGNGVAFGANGGRGYPAGGWHYADWYLVGGTGYEDDDADDDGFSDAAEELCGSDPQDGESTCATGPVPPGWPSYPPLPSFGPMPSFAWPSMPPFSWPSYPPFPSFAAGDMCEGPDDADLALCQLVSSPSPGGSFEFGIPDPSGAVAGFDALASAMAEKVPFGIVPQVGEALMGAADNPAGAAVEWCGTVPLPMFGSSSEFCVAQDFFDELAVWRPLFAGVIWLMTALALLRIAMASVGASSKGGEA